MSDRSEPVLNRRALLAGLMTSVAGSALAGAPASSLRPVSRPAGLTRGGTAEPGFGSILSTAGLSGDKSIAVVDLASGRVLEAEDPARALPPASVAKIATALYGLRILGPSHQFTTRVLATGPVANGLVQGDLVLVGGGDPHLDSDGFGDLVTQLAEQGITGVTGKFRIYDGALPFIDQIDDQQPDYAAYNPTLSGLILNFNRVFFEWKSGKDGFSLSLTAPGLRYRPEISGIKITMSGRASPTYRYTQIEAGEAWSVRKAALGKGGGRWLPVRKPLGYAGEVFRLIAADHGIALPRAQRSGPVSGTQLAAVRSAELTDMLRSMLRFSTNATAEAVGLAASIRSARPPRALIESGGAMTDWLESTFETDDALFVDHSGLGDASRISADDMLNVLRATGSPYSLRPILKPVRLTDARGRRVEIAGASVVAKTGTLNFVSALAGYIACPNGRQLAFAIFTADLDKRAAVPEAQRERPPGARPWANRSRRMQQALLRRWIQVYGT